MLKLILQWLRAPKETKERMLEQKQRAEHGIASLQNGQLPDYVISRLTAEKNQELPWTSTLSVNDWYLLKQYQMQPLGAVKGTASYHLACSIKQIDFRLFYKPAVLIQLKIPLMIVVT